jgi:lysophospholipase L1-like esterase
MMYFFRQPLGKILNHNRQVPKTWSNVTKNSRIKAFNAVAEQQCKEKGFLYVDLYGLSGKAPAQLFGDAVHLSGKGDLYYGIVADMVWKAYKKYQQSESKLGS